METIEPVIELKRLLERHGLDCVVENDWVVPNATLPAIRGLWYPYEVNGVLNIQVLIKDGLVVEECFAGLGEGLQAFRDAFHNFMVNSLHVLLAALWGANDPEQVTTEQWRIGDKEFTAYIGNFGTRASEGTHPAIPDGLFEAIERAVKKQALPGNYHWVRTFFCNLNGEWTFEALLDNENWAEGIDCLQALTWEKSRGYYSVRNFMLLRAT